jgi:hypothetical protein
MHPHATPMQCDCEGMLYAPRGEVHVEYAAGLGINMEYVDLQYKRNIFDVRSPRSDISSSEWRRRVVSLLCKPLALDPP